MSTLEEIAASLAVLVKKSDATDKKFEALMKKSCETDKKVDDVLQLMKRVSVVEQDVKKLEKKVGAVDSRCTSLETHKDEALKRLETLESQVRHLAKAKKAGETRSDAIERIVSDAIETGSRLLNLRVHFIPPTRNENLTEIIQRLFNALGLQIDVGVRFYRLKTASSANTIIINFPTIFAKEKFFDYYLKVSRDLKVSSVADVDADKDGSLFISHDLCQTQYKIQREVFKYKSEVVLRHRINQGFVHVQFEAGKPHIRILSLEMLHQLAETARKNQSSELSSK